MSLLAPRPIEKPAAFAERMTTKNPDDVKGWRLKPSGLLRRLRALSLPSGEPDGSECVRERHTVSDAT